MRPFLASFFALSVFACGASPPPAPATPPEPVAPTEPVPAEPAPEPVAAEPAPPPPPAIPDALEAGPEIYKVLFENETVRVFETTFAPGKGLPLHRHPDHAVYVTKGGKLHVTPETGEATDIEMKKGQAAFFPADAHAAENQTKKPLQAIVVEMKNKGAAAPEGDDPLAAAPKNYKSLFDDEHVRILEVKLPKKGKIAAHAHPDHVIYVVSGGKLQLTPESGVPQDFDLQAGTAVFLGAQRHSAVNTGKTAIKGIVFEIK